MPKANVNGLNLHYETRGQGFPIVFVHEYAGSWESWNSQVDFFSRTHLTVAYNSRGYPPSDVPTDPEAYSQQHAVDDLHGILKHLEIEQAYICGLSMGGNVALHFAFQHPEMTRGIVAAGTGSGSTDSSRWGRQIDDLATRMETQGMESMAFYTKTPTRVQLLRKNPDAWEEFNRLFLSHSALGSALTFRGVQGKRPSIFDLTDQCRQLSVPTLIMVGDEDAPCIETSIFLKRNIPTSGLLVFPQTGHTMNLEEPALFSHSVQMFIKAVEEDRWATHNIEQDSDFLITQDAP